MKLEIINPIDYPDWDKLLLTNEHYSFFQTSYWAKVLHDAYGYKPLYFTAIDKGRLAVLVPIMEIKSFLTGKRGVSLPFTDFCEPMIPQGDGRGVWEALQQYGRKAGWKYLEIRGGDGLCQTSQPSSWYYEHVLDLSIGAEKVFSQFRDSHKRNIKKAKKAGVEVDISDTAEAMDEFYRLHCMTRKMHGLPPQPFSFFTNIYDHIISKGHGLFVNARYRGQVCAASVYFHIGDKAIYKYGASDFTFQDLRPNNLVMWKALEWYCEKGF
ncbi:MAG: GNAT family N-acetyltransferase, partial [Proteobacteria bacterium]|nr:GNAT family N-acetyltransferase [Pseudomonadota bacterium]